MLNYTSTEQNVRNLSEMRFQKIVDAFRSDFYVYGDGKIAMAGSLLGRGGTYLTSYIDSISIVGINTKYAVDDKIFSDYDTLLNSLVSLAWGHAAIIKLDAQKSNDFVAILRKLINKGALFNEESFLSANKHGVNLFDLFFELRCQKHSNSKIENIINILLNDRVFQELDQDEQKNLFYQIAYCYYKYEQVDEKELIPTNPLFGVNMMSVYEYATKSKNVEKNAKALAELQTQKVNLKAAINAEEIAQQRYLEALANKKKAEQLCISLQHQSTKCDIKNLQSFCEKFVEYTIALATELDILLEQSKTNATQILRLKDELAQDNVDELASTQIQAVSAAVISGKQFAIEELEKQNQEIAEKIKGIKNSAVVYRAAYDAKIDEISKLQCTLPRLEEKKGNEMYAELKGALSKIHQTKEAFNKYLNTTHLQYSNAYFTACIVDSIAKVPTLYIESLKNAISIHGYTDQSNANANVLHHMLSTMRHGNTDPMFSKKEMFFICLFSKTELLAKNDNGKSPIDLASEYLRTQDFFKNTLEVFDIGR